MSRSMDQHPVKTWLLHLESGEYPEADDIPLADIRDLLDRYARLQTENEHLHGLLEEATDTAEAYQGTLPGPNLAGVLE